MIQKRMYDRNNHTKYLTYNSGKKQFTGSYHYLFDEYTVPDRIYLISSKTHKVEEFLYYKCAFSADGTKYWQYNVRESTMKLQDHIILILDDAIHKPSGKL
jgi:hypothetical protein